MNSACVVVLTLAVFGALAEAYAPCSGTSYNRVYRGGYGAGCGTTVCDTCNCVKTVVKPVVEQIPYRCSRRVQSPRLAPAPAAYPVAPTATIYPSVPVTEVFQPSTLAASIVYPTASTVFPAATAGTASTVFPVTSATGVFPSTTVGVYQGATALERPAFLNGLGEFGTNVVV